jgi:hypothetical protein
MSDDSAIVPLQQPTASSVRKYLLYSLSLPERALRSGAGVVAGTLREGGALLVPQAFQDSKTYCTLVRNTLNFLAEDIGGVARAQANEATPQVENFVARKAVGSFLDMAGLATLHLSPVLLLAVVSDVAYGSQSYLRELADDLKQQGVIDQQSTIDHADDLLDALARTSGTLATAFDAPPLSLEGLKKTIDDTRTAVAHMDPASVIPQAELHRVWTEMREIATREELSLVEVSSAMTLSVLDRIGKVGRGALSGVRVAGTLFDRHVIDHYEAALVRIQNKGIYATLAETSGPYVAAVWQNFSTDKPTITEDLLSGRLVGQAWGTARRMLGTGGATKLPSSLEAADAATADSSTDD